MKTNDASASRRSFFIKGGATLGAGVATVAGATVLAPATTSPADAHAEREAIRQLHHAFIAAVERQASPAALPTHHAYRANAAQEGDSLSLSEDGCRATACWHVDVKVGALLEGDFTAAQMARLQGMLGEVHWETGRLHAQYTKVRGQWQIAALRFEPG